MQTEHTQVEHTAGYRGASLAVSRSVGQLVILAESLVVVTRTESARYIELPAGNVVPNSRNRRLVIPVSGVAYPVSHSAIEVKGAYGMSLGRTLLYGGQMVLPVFTVHTLVCT